MGKLTPEKCFSKSVPLVADAMHYSYSNNAMGMIDKDVLLSGIQIFLLDELGIKIFRPSIENMKRYYTIS
jgi:hypothetical protein